VRGKNVAADFSQFLPILLQAGEHPHGRRDLLGAEFVRIGRTGSLLLRSPFKEATCWRLTLISRWYLGLIWRRAVRLLCDGVTSENK